MDEEDVALTDGDARFDHLRRIHVVVAAAVAQIDDGRFAAQKVELQGRDVLARRVEVDLAVQVGAQVVGVGQHLAVGAVGGEPLEVFHLQRFVGGPGRRADAKRDGEVDGFHESLVGSGGEQ